jgi:predicted dehydrogenase
MNELRLRWGILGFADIAIHHMIPAIGQSQYGSVEAVSSRSAEKAKGVAEQFGIPMAYGSNEELLDDRSIDAVYIPLPNHLHREWVIRAAQAGKHVLCEKPIGLTSKEAAEMVAACRHNRVLLAEAFMYRHHPRFRAVRECIAAGEIGKIMGIHSVFTYNNTFASDNIRFQPNMGGGAIYDIGVYPISAARFIMGQEPLAVTVHARRSQEHGNIDMMAAGLLEFEHGVAATFACGMQAEYQNYMEIVGDKGRLDIPCVFKADEAGFCLTLEGVRRSVAIEPVNQYTAQSDDFAKAALLGQPLLFPPEDAIDNMLALDACLQSMATRTRVIIKRKSDVSNSAHYVQP